MQPKMGWLGCLHIAGSMVGFGVSVADGVGVCVMLGVMLGVALGVEDGVMLGGVVLLGLGGLADSNSAVGSGVGLEAEVGLGVPPEGELVGLAAIVPVGEAV